MTYLSAQLSVPSPVFTEEKQEALSASGDWAILNNTGARLFLDWVGKDLAGMLDILGQGVRLIGVWDEQGQPHPDFEINTQEFIAVAPDRYDEEGNVLPKHESFVRVHGWMGHHPPPPPPEPLPEPAAPQELEE